MLRSLFVPDNRPYIEKEVVSIDGENTRFALRSRTLPALPPVSEYSLESLLKAGVPLQIVNPSILTSDIQKAENQINELIASDSDKK